MLRSKRDFIERVKCNKNENIEYQNLHILNSADIPKHILQDSSIYISLPMKAIVAHFIVQ